MTEKEKGNINRRNYLKYTGALVAGAAIGAVATYGLIPSPSTVPVTVTETVTQTQVQTATAVVPTTVGPAWWDQYMPRLDRDVMPKDPWIMDYMGVKPGEYLYKDDWARKMDWDTISKQFRGKTLNVTWEGSAVDVPAHHAPHFEALTGAKVNIIPIPYTLLHEKIMADLVSGTGAYDIMAFYVGWGQSYLPYLTDLKPYAEKYGVDFNQYHPMYRYNLTGPNGEVLGLVTDADVWALTYRWNLLKKAGITSYKGSLDTWENLLATLEKLKPLGDKEGWSPIDMLYNAKGFPAYLSWNEIAFQWEDYTVLKPNTWEPDFIGPSGGGIEALKTYKKLIDFSPKGAVNFSYDDGIELWLSGKAAMVPEWTCASNLPFYPEISKISPLNTDNEILSWRIPKGTTQRTCGAWVTTAGGVSKACKEPELAFLFTMFMASQEAAAMGMLIGTENWIGFKEALADPRIWKVAPGAVVPNFWGWAAMTTPLTFIPEHYEIGEAIGAALHPYLEGTETDAEATLRKAEKAARDILDRGGYLTHDYDAPPPVLEDWCKRFGVENPKPPVTWEPP